MNGVLYLIRGLPGSGKTTFASKMAKATGYPHFEADMYFCINPEGTYQFEARRLPAAHEWCIRQAEDCMSEGTPVIVSNTFTTYNEMADYIEFAQKRKIEVVIVEMTQNFGSIHGVPQATMEKMARRWQPFEKLPENLRKEVYFFRDQDLDGTEHPVLINAGQFIK